MFPLDWAVMQAGRNVRVVMRTGRSYVGVFLGCDSNINLVLDKMVLWDTKEVVGKSILNGSAVAYIESSV